MVMKKIGYVITLVTIMILSGCCTSKTEKPVENKDVVIRETPENAEPTTKKQKIEDMTKVLIKTSLGDITIALYDATPEHKKNFLKLVDEKYYDNVLFHRIIQGFMIQTGDPNSKTAKAGQQLGNGGPGYTIPAEFVQGCYHKRGAVAAARMGDNVNPQKASSGSQFYIVDGQKFTDMDLMNISRQYGIQFTEEQKEVYKTQGGAPFLDNNYTVFGEVVTGMDVVDNIAAQQKDRFDRPINDIKIISVEVVENK